MKTKINIITLGCSKNIVDSEYIATQLNKQNFKIEFDKNNFEADIVIINTCGFILDAKQESIDTILQYVDAKKNGLIQELYVTGCLSERYMNDLKVEIPDVDEFFGVNDLKKITENFSCKYKHYKLINKQTISPKHYAYLKISEGCNRKCSFCAIPLIRGKHKSMPIEFLVSQAQNLVKNGVKELILIAQDLCQYGYDLYNKSALAELLIKLIEIKELHWIRLHYAYPANFPEEILQLMRENEKICNYIDIPIQHISDNILSAMKRGHTNIQTVNLLNLMRNLIPDIAVRTTLLVGFPEETDKNFNELLKFIKNYKFDRLGCFGYSEEEDTFAAKNYNDNISAKKKNKRIDEIMQTQMQISLELNQKKIGKIYKTIIDYEEGDFYVGRTQYDSPEVDNSILIAKNGINLEIGNFYDLIITKAEEFDLYGEIYKKHL